MCCYRVTTTPCANGDGSAMAYRDWVETADMEFGGFYAYNTT